LTVANHHPDQRIGMVIVLCLTLVALAGYPVYRLVRRRRERHSTVLDLLAHVFPPRELRELDARLELFARRELPRR
jgi:hypothetical protein